MTRFVAKVSGFYAMTKARRHRFLDRRQKTAAGPEAIRDFDSTAMDVN
jgi:hypothetical protein